MITQVLCLGVPKEQEAVEEDTAAPVGVASGGGDVIEEGSGALLGFASGTGDALARDVVALVEVA